MWCTSEDTRQLKDAPGGDSGIQQDQAKPFAGSGCSQTIHIETILELGLSYLRDILLPNH